MNRLNKDKQIQIISALVEGNSMRGVSRMTGVSINTVTKLLEDTGQACFDFQDEKLRNLTLRSIQCDEIWSFCYSKHRNVPRKKKGKFGYGDVWTWTAIDADTKLVPSYLVGKRDFGSAVLLIRDLKERITNRFQITTDGHRSYIDAIERVFGTEIDFAQMVKLYSEDHNKHPHMRYSPGTCIGTKVVKFMGEPNERDISTSFCERNNLTMRMGMRRFTRLTNGFSKKLQNLEHALALHFTHYNFCRIHKSLRVTPAMEAGITKHLMTVGDIIDLTNSKYLVSN